jgi:hypothetical protein
MSNSVNGSDGAICAFLNGIGPTGAAWEAIGWYPQRAMKANATRIPVIRVPPELGIMGQRASYRRTPKLKTAISRARKSKFFK